MAQTIFYIDLDREKRNTAGAKAPDDIAALCAESGFERFVVPNFPTGKNKVFQKIWLATICTGWWSKIGKNVHECDVVLFQHPMYGKRVAMKMIPRIKNRSRCKFVAIVHDLESLRGGIEGIVNKNAKTNKIGDSGLLKCFDAIICHNEHMKQYMISQGFDAFKIVTLEIFDYLTENERVQPNRGEKPSIAIAGNLAVGKCRYIYDICDGIHNKELTINLYGNNYTPENGTDHMIWHGSFKPEELPEHLHGDFGLVWDGDSVDTCAGNTGAYLRYNNPHKTSLYLACGMPVIVWREAAIADFVLKNEVGIAVESLSGLDEIISAINDESYQRMCKNAARIGQKLRDGEYFKAAMEQALEIVK